MAAWPREMPPSLAGTSRWEKTRNLHRAGIRRSLRQQRILKAPAAEADAVEVEVGAHAAAHFNNGGDERVVEAGSDVGLRLAGFEAGDHSVDHRAEVDVGRRGARESEVVGVRAGSGWASQRLRASWRLASKETVWRRR